MFRALVVTAALALCSFAQTPFTVEAMLKLNRISDPQLSPDGKLVTFVVETEDIDKNSNSTQIWIVSLNGGEPSRLTTQGKNERPRWMPDSKHILFTSTRSGSSQIWMMDTTGVDQKQITSLATEASGEVVSPDGKYIVFTSEVYPSCTDEPCNRAKFEADNRDPVKARMINSLLYRHWKSWRGKRRNHLLSMPVAGGPYKDLTPWQSDVPAFEVGGPDDYVISPDSAQVAYVANLDPVVATSTNLDIYAVPIQGGDSKKLTNSPGADRSPMYSPDGKLIAFRSQARAGFEADRWRLGLIDRSNGSVSYLNDAQDRPVESVAWYPDSSRIFFVMEDRGRESIQFLSPRGGGARVAISGDSHFDDVQFTPDGKGMIYIEESASHPAEIYRASSAGGAAVPLTRLNDALLSPYHLGKLDNFWVESEDHTRINSFVLNPPNFQANQKYPVLFLIHGGPQSAWGESWTYRWNPQIFASAGYVVVMPNPRGSTGYGQKFTDEISGDWGGKPFQDLMAVVDYIAAQPYADPDRFAAAGASYGGYMIDWILGHAGQRFKALVTHAGVYDLRSEFGETEELWFPLWEFQGTPWSNPEIYEKWSPSMFVNDFKTPTLVTHGELDFRVPVGQGMQLFTALQLQKVPSRLMLFPDEGHWILKPANSALWYRTVLDWLGEWTAKKQ